MNNKIGYFEIQANDLARARDFYGQVFNWRFVREENLPIEYWRIEGAGIYGGLLPRPAKIPVGEMGTNAYVCSIQVDKFDEIADKILAMGGVVAMPKFAVRGRCWQGYFLDTEGNTLGVFEVDEAAK
jgi:predicted enzyme related to lactoylglutathione lyase